MKLFSSSFTYSKKSIYNIIITLFLVTQTLNSELEKINYVNLPEEIIPPKFGQLIDPRIELRFIENILSDQECDYLIKLSEDILRPSGVVDKGYTYVSDDRTSYSASLNKFKYNPKIIKIMRKFMKLFGDKVERDQFEDLQVVRYHPGQFFKNHFDWFNHEKIKSGTTNQRMYTIFIYLNDIKEGGGETDFPNLNLKVQPKKGSGAFWINCLDEFNCLEYSLHAGLPPQNEIKYGLNVWITFPPKVKTEF